MRAGLTVTWANDHDPDCVHTYRLNFSNDVVHTDIATVSATDVPDCDVVVGGFPCQGFSRANLRRSADDSRNALYSEFVRILRSKEPAYFVAENVPGILSLDSGRVMEMIVADFKEVGYEIDYKVVNMADYGVPQTCRSDLSNGLCMRSDVHSLFGAGHMRLHPSGAMTYSEAIRSSVSYGELPPTLCIPDFVSLEAVEWRWNLY